MKTKNGKTAQKLGKEFEEDAIFHLRALMPTMNTVTHRLYDTHSAGSFLPAQPGDCITVFMGKVFLFEFKSSLEFNSLSEGRGPINSLFSAEQLASMRIWHRAGAMPFVFFKSFACSRIERWSGLYVAETAAVPAKRLNPNEDVYHYQYEPKSLSMALQDTLETTVHAYLL